MGGEVGESAIISSFASHCRDFDFYTKWDRKFLSRRIMCSDVFKRLSLASMLRLKEQFLPCIHDPVTRAAFSMYLLLHLIIP